MDHLRIIFALESKLKQKNIPSEFDEAIQRFEDKKVKTRFKKMNFILRYFKLKKTGRTSRS